MRVDLVLVTTLLTASVALTCVGCDEQVAAHIEISTRKNWLSDLPRLFDFVRYKSLFKKHYGSLVEELARRTLFMGRAFMIIIRAIAYKFNRQTSYLALNDMSDWTIEERNVTHLKSRWLDDFPRKLKADSNVNKDVRVENRNLSENDLIKAIEPSLPQDAIKKVTTYVPSNNPTYSAPDLKAFGAERVEDREIKDESVSRELMSQLLVDSNQYKELADLSIKQAENAIGPEDTSETNVEDQVYVDHRKENCFFLPRSQGRCGSCYIFNTISLIEWKYCRDTGKLVAFSEQYPIDCGQQSNLKGCEGGRESDVIEFTEKYGLELRRNYPYIGRNEECPYQEPLMSDNMGYLRADQLDWDLVAAEQFEDVLRREPILVAIAVGENFPDYGGGVDQGSGCRRSSMHSMLLVGSGREGGREYWLFKNSYGVHFGNGGYYKLDKASGCMCEKVGIVLRGDFNSKHKSNVNIQYDENPLRTLFYKSLMKNTP